MAAAPSSSPSQRVMLVTGATGFIGSRLANVAMSNGFRVRTLTRSDWLGAPAVPEEARFFGSLPGRIPAAALEGVDIVAHCAGTAEPGERLAAAVNVDGTVRLAEAARDGGVQTFVFLSSQSAIPDAVSAYGRTKLEAERRLLEMAGIRVVILRPGLVTGPGARGLFQRMTATVEKLPVVPLLGGGKAIVQPIHVDDLCAAILRCDELSQELDGRVLSLGDPTGVTLGDLVQEISKARFGRRKRTLRIPVAPVELVVRGTEALHVPLPVNSNNLKGLRTVQRMETAVDMETLGVPVRSIHEALGLSGSAEAAELPAGVGPVRILLVGAGRVGLVHAVTLTRLRGALLTGLVDRSRDAIVFLQRIGIRPSGFPSVQAAVAATGAEAAVIATPPSTHLALARECLEQGLAVMVEKPLAARPSQLAEFEDLLIEFPEARIQVGYLMPQIPQVATILQRLRSGELGQVIGFEGFTLLSFVEGPLEGRWEVDPEVSGGGALINAGGHVLSMIREAFGDPDAVAALSLRLHSDKVEDSMVVDLEYGGFNGRHYVSWSAAGFPRQENMLRIRTSLGEVVISSGLALFLQGDGQLEVFHALDTDVGFNMAPDYVGAGFTAELSELRDAARGGPPASMDIAKAGAVDRLLFRVYEVAQDVQTFSEGLARPAPITPEPRLAAMGPSDGSNPELILDLRGLETSAVGEFFSAAARVVDRDGFHVFPEQLAAVPKEQRSTLGFTVPDFLTQGRLLSLGRHREVLLGLGVSGVIGAMKGAGSQALRDRSATLWVGALGLLGGSLAAIPRGFEGSVFIHPALVDLALSLRRYDMLERMLAVCRAAHPRARVGIHTNLVAEAADFLTLTDADVAAVSVLTSPNGDGAAAELRAAAPGITRIVAEVGTAPALLHQAALLAPRAWAQGADAVLIGASADPFLRSRSIEARASEWRKVFPGLAMPEGAP